MRRFTVLAAAMIAATTLSTANAAFIVQPDVDGVANTGTLNQTHISFNPKLSFPNASGPTNVGVAVAAPGLVGVQPGNTIFGGNSATVDRYQWTYKPGTDADNAAFTTGQALGAGNLATGLTGGGSGLYRVYAAWLQSANISDNGAVPTNYIATGDGPSAIANYNQDEDTNGAVVGNVWQLIGLVNLTAGNTYTVTQAAPNSSFVSMRAAGVMWELVTPANVAPVVTDEDDLVPINASNPGLYQNDLNVVDADDTSHTWTVVGLDTYTAAYGGAGPPPNELPANPSIDNNGLFSWNTVGFPRGIYKWKVNADDGAANDDGFVTVRINQVPEPATFAVFGLAMVGLVGVCRRR
jgi:hypothetical protein